MKCPKCKTVLIPIKDFIGENGEALNLMEAEVKEMFDHNVYIYYWCNKCKVFYYLQGIKTKEELKAVILIEAEILKEVNSPF